MPFRRAGYLAAAALLCNFHTAAAQTSQSVGDSNDIKFQWAIREESASSGSGDVYFQLDAPDSYAWVGLGIGSRMRGAEIFLMYQDGEGNVTLSTREGVGHVMPEHVERNSVELMEGSGVVDGRMIANVRCGDCNSLDLSGSSNWISAWSSGASLDSTNPAQQITIHDDMTRFEVDLAQATISADADPFSEGTSVDPPTEDSNSDSDSDSDSGSGSDASSGGPDWDTILLAHGVIMTLVFCALYPIGALLMPILGKWLIHASFQTLAFLLMWAGFALGYLYAEHDGYLWRTHTLLGVVVVSLMGLQPILGFLHHRHYAKHQGRGIISHAHIWYGRALMIIGIVNGGLGLELAGKTSGAWLIAYCVVASVVVAAYIASIVFGLTKKRRTDPVKEKSSSGGENGRE